ncbi:HNH/ENDO VII family nuclease [Micromonospora sp. WMMD1102]|uniref:HNH/ENDO VII family nuclease n=1 Tax=Micromonospora sp. WMMD1102 TaxID=3016105 RepID=UPI00241511A9|nr:HNH/ENDO VII family nuclease [Micromonospora sp. WMMD1102]MDG4789344.1 HNH/ENDO VII family nuclease [Micromonospora sp. WMMD1102]
MARRPGRRRLTGAAAKGVMRSLRAVVKDGEPLPPVARSVRAKLRRDPYRRPKTFRRGLRDKVWKANKGPDGKVRDPLTGRVIRRFGRWDMGHKPGYEFRKHQASARRRRISRKEFLDEHNNPDHYRPELPSSNRGRAGEDRTDDYLGP